MLFERGDYQMLPQPVPTVWAIKMWVGISKDILLQKKKNAKTSHD